MPLTLGTLFETYREAMALVEGRNDDGDITVGSAFHLGDGLYATARHVLDDCKVDLLYPEGHGAEEGLEILDEWRHREADVAVFRVDYVAPSAIALGGHLDDWINDEQFLLADTLVMGYPPVPFADRPVLVAVTGEINAVIDRYDRRHPHFVVSPLPRGGFSGGPAIVSFDFALGVISQELRYEERDREAFTAVISVEPLWDLIIGNKLYPSVQRDFIDEVESTWRSIGFPDG